MTSTFEIARQACYCPNSTTVTAYTPTTISGYTPIGIVGISAIGDTSVYDYYELRFYDADTIYIGWASAHATTKGLRLSILYVKDSFGVLFT